ncbi:uncharacterized protein PAC_03221 [Phialocephala subalpina]|uniref:Cytochrome P450 n=1 Tax=Phialocephala subalpina TaxID=576137 RepID=A0A1L7WKV1_9HELO|nr:uncharacterized protein PAC_03221 [Phialocephala subalpina]
MKRSQPTRGLMFAVLSLTTAGTAYLTCWLLTRHPDMQEKLLKELRDAFPVPEELEIKKTMDLPFFDAAIRETIMMYSMFPIPLERYDWTDIRLRGMVVPPGVIASTGAYTQGRLADVYPKPDERKLDKWLEADESRRLD